MNAIRRANVAYDKSQRFEGVVVVLLAVSGRMCRVADREHEVGPGQAAQFRQPSPTAYSLPPDASREDLLQARSDSNVSC